MNTCTSCGVAGSTTCSISNNVAGAISGCIAGYLFENSGCTNCNT